MSFYIIFQDIYIFLSLFFCKCYSIDRVLINQFGWINQFLDLEINVRIQTLLCDIRTSNGIAIDWIGVSPHPVD